ncbi:MAG: secondary thiamine-phosphate synthase enzyme YjbQ [Acidobacteriota bacterium]|nr:secondary thiamine-phosphate synthase enzyme YjbQ [Acidobacteriota bacterium]
MGRAGRAYAGEVSVRTSRRSELVEITAEVEKAVAASSITEGVCYLFVPHTTAGVIVNENDDPAVARDIEKTLDRLVPCGAGYEHLEGNADAHVKSSLVGVSAMVFVERGRLALGRWQGVFFCEFDGPRDRRVRVKILADPSE